MAWIGPPTRVKLTVNLTRYHEHLIPGVEGITLPRVKMSDWGWQDRFSAIQFDCCGKAIDVLESGFEILENFDESHPRS